MGGGRGSYATSSNVGRLLNLTHAGYGYMSRGAGFHGPLSNIDVSRDGNIDHLNIDKSARLHTQVLSAILEVAGNGGGNQRPAPIANDRDAQRSITTPQSGQNAVVKPADSQSTDSVTNSIGSELPH